MAGSILGNPVRRTEDPELLTVGGRYVADLGLERVFHVAFVRAPVAHATITAIDTSAAATAPGVLGAYTASDLGLPTFHSFVKCDDDFARSPLAGERVRFVGEAVVAVAAESRAAAADAAELVEVDYDVLPAVVDAEEALAEGAELLFPAHGSNLALTVTGDHDPDLFADADVVVRGRYVNQRLAPVPLEPDSFAAVPQADGTLTVYAATQMPHLLKAHLAPLLGLEPDQLRVIAPHVGGGFGAKVAVHCEQVVVSALARIHGRPATWTETRSESMVALPHSRGQVQYAELGATRDGRFTGLRVHLVGDAGAYPALGAMLPAGTRRMGNGVYAFPRIQFDVAVAATTTTPMAAYRGAGRPEAAALLERLVDHAALELGIDPLELRRTNFLPDDAFPFTAYSGVTYDSGAYDRPLREAARIVDYEGVRAEQAARRERGDRMQLGVGVSTYVEITAGGTASEYAGLEVHDDGSATVYAGTSAHGQGHQTSYAMIVAEHTGIPVERIRLVQSDTAIIPTGGGTGGSRSMQIGGSAVHVATEAVVDRARELAARELEASVDDIVVDVDAGTVGVAGVPARALSWAELATAAAAGPEGELAARLDWEQQGATFPFGAHIAVAEVDTETGRVELLRHVAVDDAGTVINPLLLAGQQHGGVAQGAAQALYEGVEYDSDGNPLTASLIDYAFPSAAELPSFDVASTETPTPLNPLGAKGIGEASTIGATPAVQNAAIDALAHLGVRHIDMPLTPERVWRVIEAARAGSPPDPWREPPAIFTTLRGGQDVDEERLSAAEGV